MTNVVRAVLLDAVLVIAFSTLGVFSHDGSITPLVVARVAWPFLVGLIIAHLVLRTWRAPIGQVWPRGIVLVLVMVSSAMLIRALLGAGTELTFVIVSIAVNATLLLGWRAILTAMERRKKAH